MTITNTLQVVMPHRMAWYQCQLVKVAVFAGPMDFCRYSNIFRARLTWVSAIIFRITYTSRVYSYNPSKTLLCRTRIPTFKVMKTLTSTTKLCTCRLQLIITEISSITSHRQPTRGCPNFKWLTKLSVRREITSWLSPNNKEMCTIHKTKQGVTSIKWRRKIVVLRLLLMAELIMTFATQLSVVQKLRTSKRGI